MGRIVQLPIALSMLASAAAACGSSSSDAQTPCNITGSYKVHYTIHAGSPATCTAPADSNEDLTPPDAGSLDAGPSCVTEDPATCTVKTDCSLSVVPIATDETISSVTFVRDGSSGSGTIEFKSIKYSDGSVLSDCTFDVTYTRQ